MTEGAIKPWTPPPIHYGAGVVAFSQGFEKVFIQTGLFNPLVWVFPKGHIEENELPVTAAIREAYEEAGLVVGIEGKHAVNPRAITAYWSGINKDVMHITTWYTATILGITTPLEDWEDMTGEKSRKFKLVSVEDAMELLSFDELKYVLQPSSFNKEISSAIISGPRVPARDFSVFLKPTNPVEPVPLNAITED